MEKPGNQPRHKDETYAQHMARLYKAPPINYANQKRDPSGRLVQQGKAQRPYWGFRPPVDLAKDALKFMREQDMSVTTYLTYAMHNLHNNKATDK